MKSRITHPSMINNTAIAQNLVPTQIVFIDAQVEDLRLLTNGVIPGIETVVLEGDRNGIEQITEALSQRTDLTTIHIVSHGSPGSLHLGNTKLSLDTLNKYQEQLKTWFNIPPFLRGARGDRNLLLYGCNVAAGDAGAEFITKLHNITGAEIAASTTLVGNLDKGGNWQLDVTTSELASNLPFNLHTQETYSGVFATVTYNDDPNPDEVIPDDNTTGISRTFTVTDDLTITDVNIGIDIKHTWREDLDITLQSPGGTTINLTTDNGGSNDNLYVTFDDQGSTNITSDSSTHSTSGYTNLRIPEQALSAFDDESSLGTWTLTIKDDASPDTGNYQDAQLTIEGTPITVPNEISGNVFLDEDLNGANEEGIGIDNITVTAYDASGTAISTAQTAADGTYTLTGVNDTTEYRIEFTNLPTGYFESSIGTDSDGSVAFATGGENVSLGLHTSTFQPVDNALVRTYGLLATCGVDGTDDYVLALTNASSLPYNSTTYDSSNGLQEFHHPDWTLDKIGNIYFTEFDTKGNIFAPASKFTQTNYFRISDNEPRSLGLQQYGSIGGSDAIYKMDAVTGAPTVWANLPQAGGGNSDAGMGGVTYDATTDSMYVVNMHDGTIYRITGSDNATGTVETDTFTPTLGTSTHSTGATFDNTPFGLDIYDGRLYYTVHDATGGGSLVVRSVGLNADGSINTTDDQPEINEVMPNLFNGQVGTQGYSVVADIDFSPTGQMAVGSFTTGMVSDSFAPESNYYADKNQSRLYNHDALNYVYEIDSDTWNRTAVTSVSQGSSFEGADVNASATGGVAWSQESDALETLWMSGGDFAGEDTNWGVVGYDSTQFDNTVNQEDASRYTQFLFPSQEGSGDPKGNGGEVDVFAFDPIEIGNRIWNDSNADGIQDPGEAGINDVTINLYNAAGDTLLGTTTTDAAGEYYFNESNVNQNGATGLEPNTDYQIQIDPSSVSLDELILVPADTGSNDNIDSDATLSNSIPTISVTTGDYGENNFTLDAGFTDQLVTNSDYGDAPDRYETTAVNNGARHPIVTDLSIGDTVDSDDGTQTNAAADEDGADEDGVTFTNGTTIDQSDTSYSVDVVVNAPGGTSTLANDDFSQNNNIGGDGLSAYKGGTGWAGDWVAYEDLNATTVDTDADEGKVRVNEASDSLELTDNGRAAERKIDLSSTTGDITLNFNYQEFEAGGAIDPGEDPLEIWISNNNGANFTKVESLTDPATSSTDVAFDLTPHVTRSANTIIRFRIEPTSLNAEIGYSLLDVDVTETTSTDVTLVSWIDFNRDGQFDPGEKVTKSTTDAVNPLVADGTTPNTIGWTGFSDDITSNGDTYARFRLSTDAASIQNPNGAATDGEVEDYQLSLTGVENDYGDAPDSLPGAVSAADNLANNNNDLPDYETRVNGNNDGANHTQDPNSIITIGDTVDADDGTQQDVDATADGTDEDGVFVAGTTNSLNGQDVEVAAGGTYSVDVTVNTSVPSPVPTGNSVTFSGTVFNDYDNDGTQETGNAASEVGLSGITVTAYNNAGDVVNTTSTNVNGGYTLENPNGEALRIEFTDLPEGFVTSANSGSDVIFSDGTSNETTNLGVVHPDRYVDSSVDPTLVVPCYVFSGAAGSGGEAAIVTVLHSDSGQNLDSKQALVPISDVGAVNGLAYHKETGDIFAGAFQKRHSDIGPEGNSAIYRIDDAGNTNTFIKLDDFFGADSAGAYSHDNTNFQTDSPAFSTVGKVALGDVEISEDRQHIWTVNLDDRKIYKIAVGDSADPTTPIDYAAGDTRSINTYDILGEIDNSQLGLNPTQNIRPFALAERNGLIYVGMVNSAQYDIDGAEGNTTSDDLHAYIYTFNPETETFSSDPVLDFSLDYERENLALFSTAGFAGSANWIPWQDNINKVQYKAQPTLSDIEFDNNGDIILGFRDRTGDQIGPNTPSPNGNDNYQHFSGGEILRASSTLTNQWTIEPSVTDSDRDLTTNPEHYDGESYTPDLPDVPDGHYETAQGGLTQIPGFSGIETTAMDPLSFDSGGIISLDNTSGDKTASRELFEGKDSEFFEKANGLGDLEYFGSLAPIEIGNRVWIDSDGDGIQDAGESGVSGVTVNLYDDGGTLVGTTTTDAKGEYYFNEGNVNQDGVAGLNPNANYEIRLDNAPDFADGGVLNGLELTVEDANANANDTTDSDAVDNAGTPTISVTTKDYGENDYSYDAGFAPGQQDITLVGWIDFDRSGTFDPDEAVTIDTANGLNTDGTANTLDFTVPDDVEPGETAARFRVASGLEGDNLDGNTPNGAAPDGEVEDYIVNLVPTYSLSGTVLEDVEDDNAFSAGDTPISGVTVELFADDGNGNPSGNAIASKTTNATGFYEFTGLDNGNYVVVQTQPGAYDSVTDIDTVDDNKILATIADANVTGRDFLEETPPSKITGLVWNDPGFEGIQDPDEVGVDGVTVNLYLQNDPNTPVATTTTSSDGTYEFIVNADDYFVQFVAPENNVFSLSNIGGDDTVDSDVNRATGRTENITLSAGETIELDAGISPDSDGDSIPDVVEGTTGDRDNDGIPDFLDIDPAGYFYEQNTGEVIPGGLIEVTGPGAVNITDDASTEGFYEWFIDGTPGTYTMGITPPPGYIISPDHLPQTPALDPTGLTPDPFEMGESQDSNTGALFDFSEANNPYYLEFDLAPNDPFVINNNIPFVAPPTLDLDADNNSGAVDPDSKTTFLVGSGGVAIALDPIIEDLDATTIDSATITLTARPDGDANESLNVNGSLPSGITASSYDSGTGVLTLSGSASLADYQTAISQIEYDNTAAIDTSDRTINVVINDGDFDSNIATSTIAIFNQELDFGDAPDRYQTTAVNNGASHPIVTDLSIGDTVDSDDGTQTNAAADEDGADEDGVTFANGTTIDQSDTSYSVDVIVNAPGGVSNTTVASDSFDTDGSYGGGTGWNSNWVESDGNGAGSGNVQVRNNELEIRNNDESAARELTLPTGASNVVLSFDYTRVGGLNSGDDLKVEVSNNGGAFTQVREITFDGNPASDTVTINLDGLANNSGGATTIRFNTNDLSGVSNNDGYDLDNINITGDVGSATDVTLVSWIDFNRDGNFDTNERVVKSTTDAVAPLVADGVTPNTIGWTGFSDDITSNGDTYARFRLSTDAASIQNPNGVATDGEVEDYQLSLTGVESDYGDAPDSLPGALSAADNLAGSGNDLPDYETTEADGGANHTQDPNNIITIGDTVDADDGTQQNATATADDTDTEGDDEDGVVVSGTNTSLNGQDIDIAAGGTYSVDVIVESTVTNPPTPPTGIASTVSGTVFNDYDSDGDFDGTQTITFDGGSTTTSTEGGLEDVTVTAYDNGGNIVGTATTDANGEYTINNPTGEALRVEFTNLPVGYNRTSDSSVFVDGSNSTVDLGALQDNQYVDSNSAPRLFTTCFVRGNAKNLQDEAALVSVLHTNQGQSPANKQTEVTYDQVGTVYGLAYSKQTQDIFLGSFQRRHTDLGPGGNDAIYRADNNGDVNTLVELDTYFNTTDIAGAYSHGDSGVHDETNRPTQFNDWIQDELGFAATTKVGFGDVEISADGEHIWTINLADRKLYKIEVGDGSTYLAQASESRTIEDFDIVNNLPGLEQGTRANAGDVIQDLRPFALSEHNGRIYVGLVDSAQGTQNTGDLHAYVYSFDPTAATPSYTQELAFALDYERQGKSNVHSNANWQPWVDNFGDLSVDLDGNTPWVSTTQPILSDIEFDNNGDIIVGFRDRTADQIGPSTPDTEGNSDSNGELYTVTSGGDILKGIWDSGTNSWSIESGATDTDPDTEFYGGEVFVNHKETAQGSLVQIPGYDSVETTALDPFDFSTGGIIGLDNTNGSQTRGIEIVENNFHKANGLGDLEAFGEVAPIEIGNRVWSDLDNDGIQDAGEVGIAGVTLSLYSNDGTLVGTTATDSNGEYYFNSNNVTGGLEPIANYEIRLDNAADFTGSGALDGFNLVVEDANGNNSDQIDSDAIDNAGTPTIPVTTGDYGENDYSYDIGFHENINTDVTLVGWIDFDRSGTFDDDEAVTIDTANGLNTDGTTNTLDFTVPADVEPGETAARFRVASGLEGANLDGTTPNAAAPDGEVEDYIVNLGSTYTLSGTVYNDTNNPSADTIEATDTPIEGVTVEIFKDRGSKPPLPTPIATTTTDENGFYEFTDLPNGNYIVVQTQPDGYDSVTDADGGTNNQIAVTIADADVGGRDFLEEGNYDYGDAPDILSGGIDGATTGNLPDYQTTEADGGASHILDEDSLITIGDTVDSDDGTQQDPDATADGADEDGVFVSGTTDSLNGKDLEVVAGSTTSIDVSVNQSPQAPTGEASTVTGTVFNDYDADGNNDGTQTITFDDGSTTTSTEGGLEGVTVTAYNNADSVVGTAITDASGAYSISNPNGDPLRIEFSDLPTDYNSTSDTSVFVDGSNTTADLGLLQDNHYVDSNSAPRLFTTCFVFGSYDQPGEAALVSVLHTDQGEGTDLDTKQVDLSYNQVGTVYGLAHSKQTQDLFLGAFHRRHSDSGPLGNDAIFRLDNNGNLNTLVELDTYFGTTDLAGAYSHGDSSAGQNENNRPTTRTEWRTDKDAFAATTKVGFGDVEITGDGEHIWTVNLADRKLYKVEVGDGSTYVDQANESRNIDSFDIVNNITGLELGSRTDAADVIQDLRPFALAERDGLMYVGLVDSAQATQDASDLHAYVYSFDPTAATPTFTKEFDFSLDYARQTKNRKVHADANWSPWIDNFADLTTEGTASQWVRDTQPILSDIEFGNNGDIILGFRDRTADQVGPGTLDTDGNQGTNPAGGSDNYTVASGGDILRGVWDSGTDSWTIESGASDNDPDTEFYSQEIFVGHLEAAQGGLVQIPGYDSVETTLLDPINFSSGGIAGFENSEGGAVTRDIELFTREGLLKANGLGDLEAAGEVAPIAIGNRLWVDLDQDGIQDAGETGIAGATVNIYDAAGTTLLGTAVTDAKGEYYFNNDNVNQNGANGLEPNTDYKIRLDTTADFASGGVLENLNITTADAGSDDKLDSDAVLEDVSGIDTATINVTTGDYGQNDYSNDFGFQKDVTLVGWIDFDRSGTFDPDEAVTIDTANGLNTDGTTNTLDFTVPADVEPGETAARFRVASGLEGANLSDISPNGAAPDGEVEDYIVNLVEPQPPIIDLDGDNSNLTGNDYKTTYVVGGSPVAIADVDVLIGDVDDVNLESASIKLAIRADGDAAESLVVDGTLPSGITGSAYDPVTGILELSGNAPISDYQTAIAQIEYTNSIGYHSSDRLMEVTVNDGLSDSNTAFTTIELDFLPSIDLDGDDSSFT